MQRSYIDYAMSVIVGRALPEVRDGLKPVHRRVLYAMFDSGFRPDRGHAKSARSVAETMGNYHPHGDSSIYDTLVRMAQPWSLRYPLVDGQGNFGSPGNDPPAAMRYCVTGDAAVSLPEGGTVPIADIVPDAQPNSDNVIDLKVLDRHGNPVLADRLFHSGEHPDASVHTVEGFKITGTGNHPLLCLVDLAGVPTLLWKLIEEIRPGDIAVMRADSTDYDEKSVEFRHKSCSRRVPGAVRRRPRRPCHRDGTHRRPVPLRTGLVGDRRRRPAGVQPSGRYGRPRVHHQRFRQSQHRSSTDTAGDGDAP